MDKIETNIREEFQYAYDWHITDRGLRIKITSDEVLILMATAILIIILWEGIPYLFTHINIGLIKISKTELGV